MITIHQPYELVISVGDITIIDMMMCYNSYMIVGLG